MGFARILLFVPALGLSTASHAGFAFTHTFSSIAALSSVSGQNPESGFGNYTGADALNTRILTITLDGADGSRALSRSMTTIRRITDFPGREILQFSTLARGTNALVAPSTSAFSTATTIANARFVLTQPNLVDYRFDLWRSYSQNVGGEGVIAEGIAQQHLGFYRLVNGVREQIFYSEVAGLTEGVMYLGPGEYELDGYSRLTARILNGFGTNSGQDDNSALLSFQAVPEPGTMAALGLGGLAMARRRRSK